MQFNDKRTDRFTLDFVEFFEKVGISIGIAVSKLKRDKALMDSEVRYKALFNGAPEGIIVADKQTKHFSYANPASCRMFGYTEEEILLLDVSDLHPEKALKDVSAGFEDEIQLINTPCLRKDGTLFYANISPTKSVISGSEHLIGFFTDTTERMKMQEEIDKLNSNFVAFLENTGDFIYFKDFNSSILFCSQTLADITGHASWRDMIGKNDMEIFPKDTAQIYYEEELPIFRDGIPLINKINPFYFPSGKKGFVSTSKWPRFNKEGKIIGLLGISRDVTEQQRKEEEIRERTKELKCIYSVSELIQEEDNIEQICHRIVELIPGAWLHSQIACASITFEGMQYKTENFRETPWRQFVRISETGLSEEVLEVCYLEERPARDEGPFLKEERNLLNSIALKLRLKIEKIRLEESLQKSLDNMIEAQAIAKVGSWELEIKNGLISSTDEFCRIFGILPGEVWTYRDFMSYVHPEDLKTVKHVVDDAVTNIKPYSVEYRIVLPDDRIMYIHGRGKVSVDINNTPVKAAGTIQDITIRKLLELELIATKDLALSASNAKSEFIANMNHELRTPLNSILGFAQVLLREYYGKLNEHQRDNIKDILDSGEHLLSLVNNNLDIASIELRKMVLKIAPVELNRLFNQIKFMFSEKTAAHNIIFEFKTSPDLPKEFDADELKLSQVAINIISNAFKFTPDGGTILVEAVRIPDDEMMISITDNGPGISKEKTIKLFTPFERLESKTEGIGLGLALSLKIVELWHGKIGVVSPAEGRDTGCRFYFTIPLNFNKEG